MKNDCPFRYVVRVPAYQASKIGTIQGLEIISSEASHNGYLEIFQCKCTVCEASFEVRMEANPYYETYVWEDAPCNT